MNTSLFPSRFAKEIWGPPLALVLILWFVNITHPSGTDYTSTIPVDTVLDDAEVNGNCTLREAILAANTDAVVDNCPKGSGTDLITFSVSGKIVLSSSLPAVSENLAINGPGSDILTISGDDAVQVMAVLGGVTLDLQGLTIANGYAPDGFGGAIQNDGDLTLSYSVLSGNRAMGGGGISNSGTATLTNVTISGNAGGYPFGGGGISNFGTLTIINSTFTGNSSEDVGGGIYSNGLLSITNVTFSNNVAVRGGGIFDQCCANILNSTFSGNIASGVGGGINNESGNITIINSTFAGNSAQVYGGGIYNSVGSTILRNTIIASSLSGGNCSGPIDDGGGNLSWPDTTCPGLNADPVLGPLADNGGFTETHALLAGSAAIDNAEGDNCPATDQRGVARPQGEACDIGAYEYELPNIFIPIVTRSK